MTERENKSRGYPRKSMDPYDKSGDQWPGADGLRYRMEPERRRELTPDEVTQENQWRRDRIKRLRDALEGVKSIADQDQRLAVLCMISGSMSNDNWLSIPDRETESEVYTCICAAEHLAESKTYSDMRELDAAIGCLDAIDTNGGGNNGY